MKKYLPVIFFAVLTVLILSFIFGMSLQSREESGNASSGIVAFLKPIFDPNNRIPQDKFHHAVRKLAHFTEFCALGICVLGLTRSVGKLKGERYFVLPVFCVLLSAVADEFIQYFSGRGSMVTDVVLDFCGGLSGIAIAAFVCWMIGICRRP
ncbi:MAG: VanZ family protein [Clostridia bacterium]|nr:VanZ family protein [Clostridia bacterium]